MLDEAVERHDREDRASGAGRRHIVDAEQLAEHGLARHRVGREIRVADDDVIAMAHGAQRIQHIGIEGRIDRFEHVMCYSP
jgi:hypothetical protein